MAVWPFDWRVRAELFHRCRRRYMGKHDNDWPEQIKHRKDDGMYAQLTIQQRRDYVVMVKARCERRFIDAWGRMP